MMFPAHTAVFYRRMLKAIQNWKEKIRKANQNQSSNALTG